MEQLEQAEKFESLHREYAIIAIRSQLSIGESSTHCLECEDPIPELRRIAVPGCKLCKECTEEKERLNNVI